MAMIIRMTEDSHAVIASLEKTLLAMTSAILREPHESF